MELSWLLRHCPCHIEYTLWTANRSCVLGHAACSKVTGKHGAFVMVVSFSMQYWVHIKWTATVRSFWHTQYVPKYTRGAGLHMGGGRFQDFSQGVARFPLRCAQGGAKLQRSSGGCGRTAAPPLKLPLVGGVSIDKITCIKETIHNLTLVNLKFKYKCEYKREKL